MATKSSQRINPETAALLHAVGSRASRAPLVDRKRHRIAVYLLRRLPPLDYPINSAGELLHKYFKSGDRIKMGGMSIDPRRAIASVPAHYFPIATPENFIEKIAALLKRNRRRLPAPAEIAEIKTQLPAMPYPVASRADLLRHLMVKPHYQFRGHAVDTGRAVKRFPTAFFPIRSRGDFVGKIATLMAARS